MSVGPGGPGWWQASDGRWYPPQAEPGYPPPGPYGYGPQPPRPQRRRSGCTTAVLIVGALAAMAVLLIVMLAIAGVFTVANQISRMRIANGDAFLMAAQRDTKGGTVPRRRGAFQ
jgi:hypothetical protein